MCTHTVTAVHTSDKCMASICAGNSVFKQLKIDCERDPSVLPPPFSPPVSHATHCCGYSWTGGGGGGGVRTGGGGYTQCKGVGGEIGAVKGRLRSGRGGG